MVNHMRHTRAHSANRRSHHALDANRLSKCPKCGAPHLRHHVCVNCGTYRGNELIDVMAKVAKRAEKNKPAEEKTKVAKVKKEKVVKVKKEKVVKAKAEKKETKKPAKKAK